MSKTISLLVVGILSMSSKLIAQCPTSQINLTSQAQVNAFPTNYPGCTHLLNSLYISGTDITTLNPLNVITAIDGFLTVADNTNLTSLNGFSNLDSVQAIDLTGNPLLQNLNGLSDLDEVDWYVNIDNNDGLLNLNGLTNLARIGPNGYDGFLVINGNQLLNDLTGAPLLDSLAGLGIINNPSLPDLDGLESLIEVDTLFIEYNAALVAIDDITGMMGWVGEVLVITHNPQLSFIGSSTSPIITEYTHITDNTLLADCCIFFDSNFLGFEVIFEGNAPSCNSILAIEEYCDEDNDEINLHDDNCPSFYNPLQQDNDADGVGNGCDNCPLVANANQADTNNNFIGNACEVAEAGKIGLGNTNPKTQLDVSGGDLYLNNTQRGIIMKNYLGECFRLVIDEDGALHTVQITCPN